MTHPRLLGWLRFLGRMRAGSSKPLNLRRTQNSATFVHGRHLPQNRFSWKYFTTHRRGDVDGSSLGFRGPERRIINFHHCYFIASCAREWLPLQAAWNLLQVANRTDHLDLL